MDALALENERAQGQRVGVGNPVDSKCALHLKTGVFREMVLVCSVKELAPCLLHVVQRQ